MKPNNLLLSVLKFVCGDNSYICRLCLSTTKSQGISLEENICLRRSYLNETLSFISMFSSLGVALDPLLPQVLCSRCAVTTINCYLFQKLYAYSMEKWQDCVTILNSSLKQSDNLHTNVQCAYFIIDEEHNPLITSRKRLVAKNKKNALAKVKENIKNRLKYLESKQKIVDTICEECGERFNSNFLLAKHVKEHNRVRHPCPKCPKIFSTPFQIIEHSKRVHYPKNLSCDKCPKMFSTEKILKTHNHLNHVVVSCKHCNIQFSSRKNLHKHLHKHNVNTCTHCKKKFNNKHTYKLHIRVCGNSEKILKFFCDICTKGYVCKNSLRTHLKVNHGFGNVLTCNWCFKKFDAKSRLKNHIVKHTRERNFTCTLCDGKFVTRPALINHIRLHTGERPFPCDMCSEKFLSASRRMEHKRRKHLEPTLECKICNVKFITGNQLRKHQERHSNPHSKLFIDNQLSVVTTANLN